MTAPEIILRAAHAGLPIPNADQIALVQRFPCLADLVMPRAAFPPPAMYGDEQNAVDLLQAMIRQKFSTKP